MDKKLILGISIIGAVIIIASTLIILDQTKFENYSFHLTDVRENLEANTFEIVGYTTDTTHEISIFLYNENGMLITQDKIFANLFGEFSTIITTGGPLFTAGTYTVIANQTGDITSQSTTIFEITKSTIPIGSP